uniref:Uncharacterized protein n=1 Tax=Marseillevirus sp. TaxID=2809551 RepID=A0AA96IYL3_9VIRU|nr:hypothetical protein MarFTMF_103 [Marseillevirus sp.]
MSKKEYCVKECVRANNRKIAKIKGTWDIAELIHRNSHTHRICEAKCDNFRNGSAYIQCEKREWRKCDQSVEECDKFVTKICDDDSLVRISKALFYP